MEMVRAQGGVVNLVVGTITTTSGVLALPPYVIWTKHRYRAINVHVRHLLLEHNPAKQLSKFST
jgi:hypothetical protein